MAGIAVLHPQDVLKDHPKFIYNSNRRKRSPQKKRNNFSTSPPLKSFNFDHKFNPKSGLPRSPPKGGGNASNLVMEKVKILKRGEALTSNEKMGNEDVKTNCDSESIEVLRRMGPEPEMVQKEVYLADFYAGTAFVASPPPSSLPLPAFFKKSGDLMRKNDDCASSDLRRLLNLDF